MKAVAIFIKGWLFLIAGFVSIAHAKPKCKVEYFSTEHGLSHKSLTHRIIDHEGFMWFATWDGINRFDGRKFISFKSYPGDSSQLGNDRIDQIVEDQQGKLWVKAYDRQVYIFDKRTWLFSPVAHIFTKQFNRKINIERIIAATDGFVWMISESDGLFCVSQQAPASVPIIQYAVKAGSGNELPSNSINFFYRESDTRIWIGTSAGLCVLVKSSKGTFTTPALANGLNKAESFSTYQVDRENMYFGTNAGNLFIVKKSTGGVVEKKLSETGLIAIVKSLHQPMVYAATGSGELLSYNLSTGLSSAIFHDKAPIQSIFEDSKGFLWLEPEKVGVYRFNPVTQTARFFSKTDVWPNTIGNRYKIFEDKNGNVWVNLKGGGFGYFDGNTGNIEYEVNTPEVSNFRLPRHVMHIHYDTAGILWLTTLEKQLIKITIQNDFFRQQLLVDQEKGQWENEVRGILADSRGRLWVGTKGSAVHVFKNGQPLKGLFDNAPIGGITHVYSIMEDRKGNIWLGTKGYGLYKASPLDSAHSKYHLTHFVQDKKNPGGLFCNEIYSLLEDQQGRVWIGSFDEGLVLVTGYDESKAILYTETAFSNYPEGGFRKIRKISMDKEGNMWIGTTNGLIVIDLKQSNLQNSRFLTFRKIPGDVQSLGNNDVQFVYCDSKGRMWIATSGGGLGLAQWSKKGESLVFRNFTSKDGLPNDYILSCMEDLQGNIWLATENGLCRFNPEKVSCLNFDSYDGLPWSGFSEASVCRFIPSGLMVFGTTNGLVEFEPLRLNANFNNASIAFINLQVNNEDAKPGVSESVLSSDINYQESITLPYNQNTLSIEYALLDPRSGSRQTLVYRLVGLDTVWHDDRHQRRITYTKLPQGNYIFEVKTPEGLHYARQPFRRLHIKILPPPWKTWWAYLFYGLFAILLFVFARRTAITMIRLRNKIVLEQKLSSLKQNFFTHVSHELRTPLTLILGPLSQVETHESLSDDGQENIGVARKNADRMLRFVNQLLDFRKVENRSATLHISRFDVVLLVKRVVAHFSEAARSRRITIKILPGQSELFVEADAEKLDVVIYNLVGNALKFTPQSEEIQVIINRVIDTGFFEISVRDNGPGVEKEKLDKIFELFYEGNANPANDIKGSGIGLALSKEFVALHGGKIWAENNPGGGLTVTVRMGIAHPKGNFSDLPDAGTAVAAIEKANMEKPVIAEEGSLIAPTNGAGEKELVLLVEDNDELRKFLAKLLMQYYSVEVAVNGKEGYQKAIDLQPGLIVSDIMMPVMDGIQMLEKVKNDINTSHIPVVLLSAKHSIESQIEGLNVGADFYITKPFNVDHLFASINNLVKQRKKLFNYLLQKQEPEKNIPETPLVSSKDQNFLKEVIRVVEEKMNDTGFNIETVATSMAMSRSVFHKKFKTLTGLTTVEFVREIRLQKSKELLDAGYNVSEVAYMTGFSTPKYFSTCFREKYQQAPSEYLKSTNP